MGAQVAAWIANLTELLTSQLTGTLKEAASALEKALKTSQGRDALLATPHGVSHLMACLSNEDDDEEERKSVVRCAARALAALSMDSAGRRGIIRGVAQKQGNVVRIGQLLRCNDLETAQCLSLIVGNLVLERSGRDLVVSCTAVIENLMGLVWSKDLKTLRYTTGALRNLSVEPGGADALKKYEGAIEAVWELKGSKDTTTGRYAAALLKNLAARPSSHSRLTERESRV